MTFKKMNQRINPTLSDIVDVDVTTVAPIEGNTLNFTGGKWKPATNSGVGMPHNVYLIPLTKPGVSPNGWTISNNFTNPDATTKGINDALAFAKNNGYNYVKLPPSPPEGGYAIAVGPAPSVNAGGTEIYSYPDTACIIPQSDTVLDLYGCTLRKETNGWSKYRLISITEKQNVTILGGVLIGDRMTHNYARTNHEGCTLVAVDKGAYNIRLYNMEVKEGTGYMVQFTAHSRQLATAIPIHWESGTFNDTTGALVTDAKYMRMNKYFTLAEIKYVAPIPINGVSEGGTDVNGGFFMITGNGNGTFGTRVDGQPVLVSRLSIDLYCYDNVNAFKGKLSKRPFDKVYLTELPTGTTQFKISFRYDITKIINSTIYCGLDHYYVSHGIEIKGCKIHDGFMLGIAITGSQQILIEDNEIYNIVSGFSTAGKNIYEFPLGIDIEDGMNVNQQVTVRGNRFHNISGKTAFSSVNARSVLIEGNFFDDAGVIFQNPRSTSNVSKNNIYFRCIGVGEGSPVFDTDTFIDTGFQLQYTSSYVNCKFENVGFQFTGYTTPDYVLGSAPYDLGSSVIPATKNAAWLGNPLLWAQTFNNGGARWGSGGTYTANQYVLSGANVYQCFTKGVGAASNAPIHTSGTNAPAADGYQWTFIGAHVEPAWNNTGTQITDAFGNKWAGYSYEFTVPYPTFSFNNCTITWTKPDAADGCYMQRGNVEFTNCKFNLEITNRYFQDASTGWDHIYRNSIALRGCVLSVNDRFGNLQAPKVVVSNCSFTGTRDIVTQGGSIIIGNDVTVEGCTFTNMDVSIRGNKNLLPKTLHFVNNKQFLGKSISTSGFNGEGMLIANYDSAFVEGNQAFITALNPAGSPQKARPFMIYVEKFLKWVDNYVESNHATQNKLELYGGLRNLTWTTGTVGVIPISSQVHIHSNHVSQYGITLDTTLHTQLKRFTGDGLTDINATGLGSTSASATEPTSGYFVQGQIVLNSAIATTGTIEWRCVTTGIANDIGWVASTVKVVGARINVGGRVYECTIAGTTGAAAPTFPATTGNTVTDNTVTWKDMGLKAVFRAV